MLPCRLLSPHLYFLFHFILLNVLIVGHSYTNIIFLTLGMILAVDGGGGPTLSLRPPPTVLVIGWGDGWEFDILQPSSGTRVPCTWSQINNGYQLRGHNMPPTKMVLGLYNNLFRGHVFPLYRLWGLCDISKKYLTYLYKPPLLT